MNNWHSRRVYFILIFSMLVLIACGGSGGSTGGGSSGDTITLEGTFSGGSHAKNLWLIRFFAKVTPSACALDPYQVRKVLVFSPSTNCQLKTCGVENRSFSISISKGSPVGVVFVGASDNYLGYLSLPNGIDSLPLTKVSSGVTRINLQVLSSSGIIVEPSHNPIGSELPLTIEEQTVLAHCGGLFASIIKNPDIDGDGKIDLLDRKYFRPFFIYYVAGGSFGSNLTPTINSPTNMSGYKFAFDATDTNRPSSVTFTGPSGSGLSNSLSEYANIVDEGSTTYISPYITNPVIPPAGIYSVAYKPNLNSNFPDTSIKTKDSTSIYATTQNAFKPPLNGQCTWYVYGRVQELVATGCLPIAVGQKMYDAFWGKTGRDAKNWLNSEFLGSKFSAGEKPQAGAIAVWKGGSDGHAAFVESVESNGTTYTVSEFNADYLESYRIHTYTTSNDTFIGDGPYFIYTSPGTLNFNIPDQSSITSNIVLAVPAMTLNGDGTINKISWNYRIANRTSTLDPQAVISDIQLQIDGNGPPCGGNLQPNRIYDSPRLSANTTEHLLTCQNLKWSNVTRVYMAYNDVYGNHTVVIWSK